MSHVGEQGVVEGGDRGWPLGVQLFGRDDLICVQQFLVKGLLKVDTELCTIEVRLISCLQTLASTFLHHTSQQNGRQQGFKDARLVWQHTSFVDLNGPTMQPVVCFQAFMPTGPFMIICSNAVSSLPRCL